jgi:hypothetical protein
VDVVDGSKIGTKTCLAEIRMNWKIPNFVPMLGKKVLLFQESMITTTAITEESFESNGNYKISI